MSFDEILDMNLPEVGVSVASRQKELDEHTEQVYNSLWNCEAPSDKLDESESA